MEHICNPSIQEVEADIRNSGPLLTVSEARLRYMRPYCQSKNDQSKKIGKEFLSTVGQISKNLNLEAGVVPQWLRALAALPEDPGSVPSTCMAAHNHL